MNSKKRRLIVTFLVAVIIVLLISGVNTLNEIIEEGKMTYNEVISMLEKGSIDKFKINGNATDTIVVMKDGTEKRANVPNGTEFINFISQKIEEGSEVEIEVKSGSILSVVTTFISPMIVIAILLFMSKQLTRGKFDVRNVKSKVTFDDVAGIEEVQEQLEDIVGFLKNPEKYSSVGAKMPRGVLLYGEPGNGKTLLAKAISGEADVKFFQVNGSSFEEELVGVGASRVRKLFDEARKNAPAIIFIDEIDSIARNRNSIKSYSEQSLNQLLAEMDGFEKTDNIVVIAATNRIKVLDPAILRPGRFDRRVYIPNPDVRSRQLILELHARNKKILPEVSFKEIAKRTVGFSGAELENVLNEAAIYSAKAGSKGITNEAIDEAITRVIVGLKREKSVISFEEKHRTAIHEAGHAIVSFVVRPKVQIIGISIVPRGNAGGYNFFNESNEIYQKKEDLFRQMMVLYGGRVAEEVLLEDISSGASNDFEKNTKIALKMITEYGMSHSLSVKVEGEEEYNKLIEKKAVDRVEDICQKGYTATKNVVEQYRSQIQKLATILEEREHLNQEEVATFMSQNFNL